MSLILVCSLTSWAQSADDAKSDAEVESLYEKDETPAPAPKSPERREREIKDIRSLSDLANLAPFSDVAVIQRRFLPKTNRFELSGSAFTNMNNPFFNSMGLSFRGAYYFRERYALEGIFNWATTSSRQVTDDLENERTIQTDNVVTSDGFLGAAFKWNPIYGKITWLNKSIVPFDLNFNLGAGMTHTTEGESEPTIHFGTSQVFALSKSMAFRWDLTWNMYQATVKDDAGNTEKLQQNDLFLGAGMSFYFPEASYR